MKGVAGRNKRRGFSLVEILVVMGIMAAVAGAGIMIFGSETDKAKYTSAEKELDVIQQAFLQYYNVVGTYNGITSGAFSPDRFPITAGKPFDGKDEQEVMQSFLSKSIAEMAPAKHIGTYKIFSEAPGSSNGILAIYVEAAAENADKSDESIKGKTIANVAQNNFLAEKPRMIRYVKR